MLISFFAWVLLSSCMRNVTYDIRICISCFAAMHYVDTSFMCPCIIAPPHTILSRFFCTKNVKRPMLLSDYTPPVGYTFTCRIASVRHACATQTRCVSCSLQTADSLGLPCIIESPSLLMMPVLAASRQVATEALLPSCVCTHIPIRR